jgi:endogenous inhibitor of DNA gyrase (YacG/DUF329 family)
MVMGLSIVITIMVCLAWSAKVQADVNAKGGCPDCGTPVPRFRNPTSFRQAMWGGWTCAECGTEMDRHGNELPQA